MKPEFLTSKTLAPVVEPIKEREAPLPVPARDRVFGLYDELKARFPGCKVRVNMHHVDHSFGGGSMRYFKIEIAGDRPNGTSVKFEIDVTLKPGETEPEQLARLFQEVDSWA